MDPFLFFGPILLFAALAVSLGENASVNNGDELWLTIMYAFVLLGAVVTVLALIFHAWYMAAIGFEFIVLLLGTYWVSNKIRWGRYT